MAGGYITDEGFVEDTTQTSAPQQVPTESVCGGTDTLVETVKIVTSTE